MKKPLQTRIWKWAAGILLIGYLAAMAWGVCWNTTLFFPMETQLSRLTGYNEVELLLSDGSFRIFRAENDTLCFTHAYRHRFLWIPMPYTLEMQIDFNLDTRTVDYEKTWIQDGGPFPNEYAQEARQLYSYRIWGDVERGAPTYDFYMGVSETEPSYALLEQAARDGDTIRNLQYAEVDGLYVFLFDEVYGGGSASTG